MAALLLEAGVVLCEAAMGAAEAEVAAIEAAAAAEEAAATVAETTVDTAAEEAAANASAAAEEAAENASAAAEAAEAAAEKAVAAESATVEATVEAKAEAEQAAEKAAELEAGLGNRIGAELGAKIKTMLNGAVGLVRKVIDQTWNLFLLQTAIDHIPEKYRKALAGIILSLAGTAMKILNVSYKYAGLSGGSEEGKKVAKEIKGIVADLQEKARKLTEPSKVKINKDTHEPIMKNLRQQVDANKKEMQKIDDILKEVDNLMKEHVDNLPHQGEEKK